MAIAKAYGSITIVDIGDLGTLSVYPESNMPSSVIYDPNQTSDKYNPDWSKENNHLKLTPVIYYGGKQIEATDGAISVTWTRKDGVSLPNGLTPSTESMDSNTKILTVQKNVLTETTKMITYICKVEYVEPQTKQTLTAEGRISFTLIVQPTTIKSCSITGESVFLYDSAQHITGAESITLQAKVNNCSITGWQYKDSNGNYVDIKNSDGSNVTTSSLAIKYNDSYFVNDMATIRLNTDEDGVYDLHVITNIRQGTPGTDTLSVVLSNEDMYVPCDTNGTVLDGALSNATTQIFVYDGPDDVTSDANITANPSGASGTYDSTNHIYTVTSLNALTATVTFDVTYNNKTISKVFYLTKLKNGVDGVSPTIYSVSPSALAINKTNKDTGTINYTPSTVGISAYQQTGTAQKTSFSGRFKIYTNGNRTTPVYESQNDQSTYLYTPSGDISEIYVELYNTGGFTTKLDSQTIAIVTDGNKGEDGFGGISFGLGNYSDVIPCKTDGTVASQYTIDIPYYAYMGISRVPCYLTNDFITKPLPSGMSYEIINDGSSDTNGMLKLTVANNATLGGTSILKGEITLNLSAAGQTASLVYSWTKNVQAQDGNDAVVMQAYAPHGDIINNGENDVILSAKLTVGTKDMTGITTGYKWYKFDVAQNDYIEITDTETYPGAKTHTIIIPASTVDSYASYKVTVSYGSQTYQAYIAVRDKTDPLQVEIFSTLGDKITNSVGKGCVYARVYQNGEEIDVLQNLVVSDTAPEQPLNGDVWAHIDPTISNINFKKYNSDTSTWVAFAPTFTCSYKWTFGDYYGNPTTLNSAFESTSRFLYIDGPSINKKMQFNLEVIKS